MHWRLAGPSVFLKLNPFSYSYRRALRVPRDGLAILKMDLAAHRNYGDAAPDFRTLDADVFQRLAPFGREFLAEFIGAISAARALGRTSETSRVNTSGIAGCLRPKTYGIWMQGGGRRVGLRVPGRVRLRVPFRPAGRLCPPSFRGGLRPRGLVSASRGFPHVRSWR
jgi:hypothetical protein